MKDVSDDTVDFMAGLNAEQQAAVRHDDGPLLVLSPAGTGKTKAMTVRIARLIAEGQAHPDRLLAVTFTQRACRELRTRIAAAVGKEKAPRYVVTFHGIGKALLEADPSMARLKPGFGIADPDKTEAVVKTVMSRAGHATRRKGRFGADPVKLVADRLSRMKDDGFRPDEADAWLARCEVEGRVDEHAVIAAEIAEKYQASLRRRNLADFGDMLLWPTRRLRDDTEYRRQWAGSFDHVVIDEYQDVNDIQYELATWTASATRNLAVVGDDDQSLYGFRGASNKHILRFQADYPDAEVVTFRVNYRSTQPILDAAASLIAHNDDRHPKDMISGLADVGMSVEGFECRDTAHEAERVVRAIQNRPAEVPLDRCAVFYRSAYQGRAIEDALRNANVGFGVIGGTSFYKRQEIQDALAYLALVAAPDYADEAFLRVCNRPARGIGKAVVGAVEAVAGSEGVSLFEAACMEAEMGYPAVREALEPFVEMIEGCRDDEASVGGILAKVLEDSGYNARLAAQGAPGAERLENLKELLALADRFDDVYSFLDQCDAAAQDAETAAEFGRVQLMTIHAAKGLEFGHVCIVGCAEGSFPSSKSVKQGVIEEERRLAYVGITRAQACCQLFWPRLQDGRVTASEPSRFIEEAGVVPVRLDEPFRKPRRSRRRSPRRKAAAPARKPWEPKDQYWKMK